MKKIPISVIIPTLNCRDKLEKHLDLIQEWLPYVNEIIAIDSQSKDGTLECLRGRLTPFNAHIVSEVKGLYRSWNKAIALAISTYTYISTIGDTINESGIRELLALADRDELDVVISSPKVIDEHGNAMEGQWPIHRIASCLSPGGDTWKPTPAELLLLAVGFAPGSILGSSASNLYRTTLLQKNPFPEEVGHIGDVLWGVQNLARARVGISGGQFAQFCWDGVREKSRERQIREQGFILALLEAAILKDLPDCEVTRILLRNSLEEKLLLLSENEKISSEVKALRDWINTILSSKINKFKIKYVDAFSLRKTIKSIFKKL